MAAPDISLLADWGLNFAQATTLLNSVFNIYKSYENKKSYIIKISKTTISNLLQFEG